MRIVKIVLTGWCVALYLQSVCLPLDLVLSGLSPTEAKSVCRCEITAAHDKGCRCPCCVGFGHEAAAHGGSGSCPVAAHEEKTQPEAKTCCRAGKTSAAPSRCRIVQAGCGCGPVADFAVASPSFSFHLAADGIAVREPPCAGRALDYRIFVLYSIRPDLPDKIPI